MAELEDATAKFQRCKCDLARIGGDRILNFQRDARGGHLQGVANGVVEVFKI
jgi:hypothetical protein